MLISGSTPQNVAAPTDPATSHRQPVRQEAAAEGQQAEDAFRCFPSPSGRPRQTLCRAGGRAHEQRQQRTPARAAARRGQQQLKALHDGQDRQTFRERIERLRQLGRPRRGQTRAAQQRRHARQHRSGQLPLQPGRGVCPSPSRNSRHAGIRHRQRLSPGIRRRSPTADTTPPAHAARRPAR